MKYESLEPSGSFFMLNDNKMLGHGDCLELMKHIPDGSVDLILTDPPYGTVKGAGLDGWKNQTTQWDNVLDFELMWSEINRVLRPNGACLLFSQEPFTSNLIVSAHNNVPFSYRLVWLKDHFANSLIAKKAPVNYFEDINVFFKKYDLQGLHPLRDYAKQVMQFTGLSLKEINQKLGHRKAEHFFYVDSTQFGLCTESTYNQLIDVFSINEMSCFKPFNELIEIDRAFSRAFSRAFNLPHGKKYKSNVFQYKKDYDGYHPTQKPIALLEDLIKTYSNSGDMVLDFTMGSGSTGVAAKNLNRSFIGIELDEKYFEIAKERIGV